MHLQDPDEECRGLALAVYQLAADLVQKSISIQPSDTMGQLMFDLKQASLYAL